MIRQTEMQIIGAELPPQQEVRRGHTFVRIYSALILFVTAAFVALAFLAHDPGLLLRIDVPVTHALQSVHLSVYTWALTHASDFGNVPLNVIAYIPMFCPKKR